jgi:hypothetical protein
LLPGGPHAAGFLGCHVQRLAAAFSISTNSDRSSLESD